jgi:hypothetical protein
MRAREFEEMDEARKEQERDRLHDLVFDGAPELAKWAAKDKTGWWYMYDEKPWCDLVECWDSEATTWTHECKNQPETELVWTDTLIRRQS